MVESLSSYTSKLDEAAPSISEPMDLVLLSLKDRVYVKCRFGRELRGKLVVSNKSFSKFIQAYDEHLNLMLNDVEEKITTIDIDPLTKQEQLKIQKKAHSLIFMRGDLVISISPTPQQV